MQLLVSAGFDIHLSLNPRITPVLEGLLAWLQLFVRNSFLRAFGDQEAEDVMKVVKWIAWLAMGAGE